MSARRILFLIIIFSSMFFLGGYSVIKQNETSISYLENRELNYIKSLTVNNWLGKEFQSSVDNAIIDNFWKRNDWLKYYNKLNMNLNILGNKTMSLLFSKHLINIVDLQSINDSISFINDISYLIRKPYIYNENLEQAIKNNIHKIELLSERYQNVEFYIYLPLMVNENDMFWNTEKDKSYLRLFDSINLPFEKFEVNSIYDIKKLYFSTDHHWSHLGSYQGYKEIIDLLFEGQEKAMIPIYEKEFNNVNFFGSHSRAIAHSVDIRGDTISKFIFELPNYKFFVDGEQMTEYGHYSDYANGKIDNRKDFDHYNWMYQGRKGIITFDTGQANLENILVISDSMSNPIRDVLASHFNKSIFINLDEYQRIYGDFKIEEYINDYNIDKVLVMVVLGNYFDEGELKLLHFE